MTQREGRVVVLEAVQVEQVQVGHEVDQVQGKPGGAEDENHAHQHSIRSLHSFDFKFLLLLRLNNDNFSLVRTSSQPEDDGRVTEDDRHKGKRELGQNCEDAVNRSRHSRPDFVAPIFPVESDDQLDVEAVGQNEGDGQEVDDGDEEQARFRLHSLAIGITDDDEPVQRDDGHRQGRHVD